MGVGTEFIFYMVELARLLVVFLIIPKVKKEVTQVLSERGDLLLAVIGKILRKKTSMNSICFVTGWSFTADGGLL